MLEQQQLGTARTQQVSKPALAWPLVSVILPIRNEGRFIERTLRAVLEQDYPSDRLEVIVADGQSTDNTRRRVLEVAAEYPHVAVLCIENPGRIVSTGFNAALEEARGDVIVRVDGHTLIAPDYVRQCVAALERSEADNVGGRMNAESESWVGRAIAAATSSPFGVGNARFHYSDNEEWVDTVYLGAWRRDVFRIIGPFDEEQVRNQDDEFNYRLLSAGGRILLSPRIKSRYFNRATCRSLARQYFQYGYWKVRVMQKHPGQMRLRQFVPALFVLTLLVLSFGTAVSQWSAVLGLAALAAYLFANAGATLLVAARKPSWAMFLLPVVYIVLHVAYGAGFLCGLVRFARHWRHKTSGGYAATGSLTPAR